MTESLYDRIGGVNAISMVVDRFSDEIVKNPKPNVNPALKEWNEKGQLPGLKFMRTLWICEATGGPFQYTGKPMGEAHKDLHITSEEFDEVGAEIASALDQEAVMVSHGRAETPVRRTATGAIQARRGDRIVIDSPQVGSPPREGEVLRVIHGAIGASYRVKWADGHETLISPVAGTATIVRP